MKKFLQGESFIPTAVATILTSLFVVSIASASSTINTNISTDGTLAITGLATLSGGASTTALSLTNGFMVNGNATTSPNGNIATQGTLTVVGASTHTGLTTLNGGASTTALSTTNSLMVNGNATTSPNGNIATVGTLTAGLTSDAITDIQFGFCNITGAAITASTTVNFNCVAATGVTTGSRIFITATTSLANRFIVTSASSSAADTINVNIYNNNNDGGTNNPGNLSLNFFGIR